MEALIRWCRMLALGLVYGVAWAQVVLPVPPLTGHVVDTTATLTTDRRQALEATLSAFESAAGTQIVVLIVPSTQPEDIFSYANRVANTWKIGRKDVGDGLLLVVAITDRRLRIEVAKSLEGAIPDLAAKQIIDSTITPRFREGDYAGGLEAGLDQMMGLVRGEALPAPRHTSDSPAPGMQWFDGLVFLFFGGWIGGAIARRMFGNALGSLATGGVLGYLVWSATASALMAGLAALVGLLLTLLSSVVPVARTGAWHGGGTSHGGWRSGSGGGGFSSGGGGNFGGGGASGGW